MLAPRATPLQNGGDRRLKIKLGGIRGEWFSRCNQQPGDTHRRGGAREQALGRLAQRGGHVCAVVRVSECRCAVVNRGGASSPTYDPTCQSVISFLRKRDLSFLNPRKYCKISHRPTLRFTQAAAPLRAKRPHPGGCRVRARLADIGAPCGRDSPTSARRCKRWGT